MASWADQISQFNPYIQQLPVEAMTQVGMYKQQKYDEGIQKVQSYIDNVAGLDVVRDIDKAYLQSKLNELGSKLKTVAAGDFSNYQLVNSVGGMATQIVKDPFVMAAVKSTSADKQNMSQIEADRKSGKLGPENEYDYMLQRKKYLEAGLTNQDGRPISFSGQYTPFRDVYAKLRGIAKDVGVDETLVQNIFNPDGTPNRVMIETLTKGKDVNKIYDAFVNGIDEGDYKQLRITGAYKYRNSTGADLLENLTNSNNDFITTAERKKADLETQVVDLRKKLASAKPDEISLINQSIDSITKTITKLDNNITESKDNLAAAAKSIQSGDEDYLNQLRGRLHTNNFLTSLSRDFAEKISHVKILDNPLWKAMMEEEKFAFDKWYKRESISIKKRQAAAAEKANKLTEQQMLPIVGATGALLGEAVDFSQMINEQYTGKMNERNQMLIDLAKWDMRRVGWDDKKISDYVKTQAKATGQSEEQVIASWGTGTYSKIKSGMLTPPSELVSQIEGIDGLNNFISGFGNVIKAADQKVKDAAGPNAVDIASIVKSAKPIAVNIGEKQYNLSPSDQVDLARALARKRQVFSTKEEDKERDGAIARLNAKFGTAETTYLIGAYAEPQLASQPSWAKRFLFGSPASALYDLATGKPAGEQSPFQKVFGAYTSAAYGNYKKAEDEVYKEMFSAYFPKNESVTLTEKSRPLFQRNMAALFIDRPEYTSIKDKLDDPNSQIVVTTVPSISGFGTDNQLNLRVVGKDGAMTEAIPMNLEQYQILFQKNPEQVNPMFALTRSIVEASPDRSSNGKGIGSIETAYFGNNAFTNITPTYKSRIRGADFVQDKTKADIYYPKIYYVPENSNTPIPIDVGIPLTLQQALSFPTTLDDNKIKNIISNQ